MGRITELRNIKDYNDELGIATRHPLVHIVNMSDLKCIKHGVKQFGFYCIFLKELDCGTFLYGRSKYDYQEGTLLFIGPGQTAGIDDDEVAYNPKGWILMFHPDLLLGSPLLHRMKDFSFFSYSSNEALHLSDKEKDIIVAIFQNIQEELAHTNDKHTQQIILSYIEVFLNLCVRFYERQFATREVANKDVLSRFKVIINDYFTSNKPQTIGLPTVSWCASQVHLSPNYFGDLVKKETGKTAQEYIQRHIVEQAKDMLFGTDHTVSEIAYLLGFQYPNHLSRMFKKVVGKSPKEFRSAI